MSEQTCCDKNISEQLTCGQLRFEVDQLKAEIAELQQLQVEIVESVGATQQHLLAQLAEARAEVERFKHMAEQNSTEMCEWMEKYNKARQEVARELVEMLERYFDWMNDSCSYEAFKQAVKSNFGLDG